MRQIANCTLCERPRPKKWSAGECLAHLTLSSEAFFPLWRAGFASQKSTANKPTAYTLDLTGRVLVWLMEPPPLFGFPTPANFQPVRTGATDQILQAFLASQKRVLQFLEEAEGLPIDQIKIRSPFNRRMSYSIWSSLVVTAAHERRHLWQAERVALRG